MKIGKVAAEGQTVLSRIRLQLGGGLVFAALAPYVMRRFILPGPLDLSNVHQSLIGTVIALVLGFLGFRQTSHYPGVRASYGILPSFKVSYGLVAAAFLLLRLDYNLVQFVVSFVLCVIWFHAVYRALQSRDTVFGVLAFGRAPDLLSTEGAKWLLLDRELSEIGRFDAIVADLHADIPDWWERFLADQALNGVPVLHVKQVKESLTGRVEIEHLSENDFGSLIPGIAFAKLKRGADFLTALVLLPFLAILLVPVALAIKLDSKGPVFFRQQRVGYRGATFTLYKLRTMKTGAADGQGDRRSKAMTLSDDARITSLGKTLRKYRIDELPQVLNVLKGEMSWIGPRPEAVALSEWYESELPFYRYRHIVRPGLTGWAQVNQGHVADVADVLWKLHYDFYYIRHFSVWLDLLIVGRTVRTVLSGFGHK
jgi:lipopolysaccharide/colanic/teichoic acid biosynthesis glycosyltransferase